MSGQPGEAPDLAAIRALIEAARLAAADPELASHQAAAMISRLVDALEKALPVVNAVVRWRGDPIYQHERAVDAAIDLYRAARSVSAASDWPAQQRRIAAKIAERYEQEAP